MAKQATKKSHAQIKREVDEILAKGNPVGTRHHATRLPSEDTRILQSDNFGSLLVRGPAVHVVELPIGAEGEYGPITEHTPDWSRRTYEKIRGNVRLEGARESGHDIEGHVRLNGKRYSAFTSGGPDDFVIVVRNYGKTPPKGRQAHSTKKPHVTATGRRIDCKGITRSPSWREIAKEYKTRARAAREAGGKVKIYPDGSILVLPTEGSDEYFYQDWKADEFRKDIEQRNRDVLKHVSFEDLVLAQAQHW